MSELQDISPVTQGELNNPTGIRKTVAESFSFLQEHGQGDIIPEHVWKRMYPALLINNRPTADELIEGGIFSPQPNEELPTKEELLKELQNAVTHPRAAWTRDEGLIMIEDESRWPNILRDFLTQAKSTQASLLDQTVVGPATEGSRRRAAERLKIAEDIIVPLVQLVEPTFHKS